MEHRRDKIIIALDVADMQKATNVVKELSPYTKWFKIGSEFVLSEGAEDAIKMVKSYGGRVFLDCKFNDITNTVLRSVEVARDFGVDMCTVHSSVGRKTLEVINQKKEGMKIIAVTVLTSLDDHSSKEIFGDEIKDTVIKLYKMAEETMCDGVVCSARDLNFIKSLSGCERLIKVTPGIRPLWSDSNDQKRIVTPHEAFEMGADFIVIGRPILFPPKEIGGSDKAIQEIINGL